MTSDTFQQVLLAALGAVGSGVTSALVQTRAVRRIASRARRLARQALAEVAKLSSAHRELASRVAALEASAGRNPNTLRAPRARKEGES